MQKTSLPSGPSGPSPCLEPKFVFASARPQSYDLIMFFKPEEVHLDRERSLALVSMLEKCPAKVDWEPAGCITIVQGDERLRSLSITATY